jgi:ribA/ribD-fused uncharacterized protein
MNEIRFYRASGAYGFLSNVWRCSVVFEGRQFPSAEHAYQFGNPKEKTVADWMMLAPCASLVAQVAHSLFPWQVRSDWSRIKVERMRAVLRAKFEANADLAQKLIQTRDAELIEVSGSDGFGVSARTGGSEHAGAAPDRAQDRVTAAPTLENSITDRLSREHRSHRHTVDDKVGD